YRCLARPFSLAPRLPPCSTLFPYTTLFRSFSAMKVFRPKLFDTFQDYSWSKFSRDAIAGLVVGIVALPLAIAFAIASGVPPEKRSEEHTLNSSHVKTSYAVFCLKKKM